MDEDDLVRLLVTRRPTIIAYAMSIVMNRDLAEDVYQSVVVVVLRKREQVDLSRDVMRWIFGVTRVESLVALRKRGKSPQVFDEAVLELLDESWTKRLASENSAGDVSEALRHCLKRITERSRKVLRLRYAEGLSGENLAEKLGVKLNTAYVTLSRIHKQLRTCIDARQARTQ